LLHGTARIGPSLSHRRAGLIRELARPGSTYLAVSIMGATVMPHVVSLHSALTQRRTPMRDDKERVLRFERIDIALASGIASLVNMAILVVAATLFYRRPVLRRILLRGRHLGLSGLMAGFMRFRIPPVLCRALTMTPALIGLGLSATRTLALSQVVHSFGIPFALVPLVVFTSRTGVMGRFSNGHITCVASLRVIGLIVMLNLALPALQFRRA
jgi:manganese transport protein